jgi:hypothetical protein
MHSRNPLPKAASPALRFVVAAICGMLVLLALPSLFAFARTAAFGDPMYGSLVLALVSGAVAWQFWLLRKWARIAVKFFLAMATVLPIIGIFNPFFASDYMAEHGGEAPNWMMLAAFVFPVVVAALWCWHVLDKHKAEFR